MADNGIGHLLGSNMIEEIALLPTVGLLENTGYQSSLLFTAPPQNNRLFAVTMQCRVGATEQNDHFSRIPWGIAAVFFSELLDCDGQVHRSGITGNKYCCLIDERRRLKQREPGFVWHHKYAPAK